MTSVRKISSKGRKNHSRGLECLVIEKALRNMSSNEPTSLEKTCRVVPMCAETTSPHFLRSDPSFVFGDRWGTADRFARHGLDRRPPALRIRGRCRCSASSRDPGQGRGGGGGFGHQASGGVSTKVSGEYPRIPQMSWAKIILRGLSQHVLVGITVVYGTFDQVSSEVSKVVNRLEGCHHPNGRMGSPKKGG